MDRHPIIDWNVGGNHYMPRGNVPAASDFNAFRPATFYVFSFASPENLTALLLKSPRKPDQIFHRVKLGLARKPKRTASIEVSERSAGNHFYIDQTSAVHRREFALQHLLAPARRDEQEAIETFEFALKVLPSDDLFDFIDCGTMTFVG